MTRILAVAAILAVFTILCPTPSAAADVSTPSMARLAALTISSKTERRTILNKLKSGSDQPIATIIEQQTAQTSCSPHTCRNSDSECTGSPKSQCGYCWAGTCGPPGR